jgi:predicted nucleic acid-binding protein
LIKGSLLYIESSALVKLVWTEPESDALRALLTEWPDRVSSDLTHVEVIRTARRGDASATTILEDRAREVIAAVNLLAITEEVLELAAMMEPNGLRSLDAIHLASALAMGSDLGAMVTYDMALAAAARSAGIEVLAPGAQRT